MIPAVVLAFGVLLSSPSAEDVRRAVQDTLSDGAYQQDLPSEQPEAWDRPRAPDVSSLSAILKALLYIGLAGVLGLAIFWVVRRLQEPRAPPSESIDEADAVPVPALSDQPLEDATSLAAQGRYTEAVHALLLQTLQILSEERTFPHSWTSREIVTKLALPEAGSRGLEDLVTAAEISFFGGREADLEDYQRCVQSFRRLQALLAGDAG